MVPSCVQGKRAIVVSSSSFFANEDFSAIRIKRSRIRRKGAEKSRKPRLRRLRRNRQLNWIPGMNRLIRLIPRSYHLTKIRNHLLKPCPLFRRYHLSYKMMLMSSSFGIMVSLRLPSPFFEGYYLAIDVTRDNGNWY